MQAGDGAEDASTTKGMYVGWRDDDEIVFSSPDNSVAIGEDGVVVCELRVLRGQRRGADAEGGVALLARCGSSSSTSRSLTPTACAVGGARRRRRAGACAHGPGQGARHWCQGSHAACLPACLPAVAVSGGAAAEAARAASSALAALLLRRRGQRAGFGAVYGAPRCSYLQTLEGG